MTFSTIKRTMLSLISLPFVFCSPIGFADAPPPIQVLDRVDAFSEDAILDMHFDDPLRVEDFSVLVSEPGAQFEACKLTATRGIFCLDNDRVRNWPSGDSTGGSEVVVDCDDPVLSAKKCTGLTVDLQGNIWLAIQDKGKTHNLFKIESVPISEACTTGDRLAMSPDRCATVWAEDKPLLLDLTSVDGDIAELFDGFGKGILALQERKTAVFIADNATRDVVEFASGKKDFGFAGNEQPQSIALLQTTNPITFATENRVLVTTTRNRVIAADTDGTPDAQVVFDIAANRDPSSIPCSSDNQIYGLRTSPKSGLTYVTDRQFCQVVALQPVFDGSTGEFLHLDNAQEGSGDLTLSTGTFDPLGPTIAPGAFINLSACSGVCPLVVGSSGAIAATLSNVSLVGDEDGMILFLIEGLPDCRLIPDVCIALLENVDTEADLITEGVIIDRQGMGNPAAQLLNVTPLLPLEVTEPFGGLLPDMFISEWYQGQIEKGFFFNAFFGFTDATFEGVFEIEIEVAELTGFERGCPTMTPPENTPASDLIAGYDVVTKVSEDFKSIDRSYISSPDHETMLINTSCGSQRGSGDRWSLMPFDLGFSADTYDAGTDTVTVDDDAVFAELLQSLHDDFQQSVNELACQAADGQASAPLSPSDCASLNSQINLTRLKFDKCDKAARIPKQSQRNENCQAYVTQFDHLSDEASMLTLSGEDPANRIGEILVRLLVIENVYTNLFFPSIRDEGFN